MLLIMILSLARRLVIDLSYSLFTSSRFELILLLCQCVVVARRRLCTPKNMRSKLNNSILLLHWAISRWVVDVHRSQLQASVEGKRCREFDLLRGKSLIGTVMASTNQDNESQLQDNSESMQKAAFKLKVGPSKPCEHSYPPLLFYQSTMDYRSPSCGKAIGIWIRKALWTPWSLTVRSLPANRKLPLCTIRRFKAKCRNGSRSFSRQGIFREMLAGNFYDTLLSQ